MADVASYSKVGRITHHSKSFHIQLVNTNQANNGTAKMVLFQ